MIGSPSQDLLNTDHELAGLVFDFLLDFGRFEYALKAAGFAVSRNGRANPDWPRFETMARGFLGSLDGDENEAVAYLLAEPPKTQVYRNGQLGWVETTQKADEERDAFLLRLVRTVRNNLFHGGKYPLGVTRDRLLLGHARTVLWASLRVDSDVQHEFFSGRELLVLPDTD